MRKSKDETLKMGLSIFIQNTQLELLHTAIKRPISTLLKTTPKKAPIQARKSNLSIFHSSIAAGMSTRGNTAAMMIEASTAFGVYLNNRVMSSNVRRTTQDITMLATAVLQPAMKFTAERENDPACMRRR